MPRRAGDSGKGFQDGSGETPAARRQGPGPASGTALDRRELLRLGSAAALGLLIGCKGRGAAGGAAGAAPRAGPAAAPAGALAPADLVLRIAPVEVEVARGRSVRTVGYNGSAPGPLVRLREGRPVTVEILNDTDLAELVHWHGQLVPAAVDGAAEERSLVVPARGRLRYRFTPGPRGLRFVHTHSAAGADLRRGTYSGQFAPVSIDPNDDPGRYDQEVFLVTHEWEPFLTGGEMEEAEDKEGIAPEEARVREEVRKGAPPELRANGWEVGYRLFSINGKALGSGEPVRVREGQRVLFRVLNASATENIRLALPGHRFEVVALDGNRVPRPRAVDVLRLGTAERIDALVEMKRPGVWVLGTPRDDDRAAGMGIVVEYAGRSGPPRWQAPASPTWRWDYTAFELDRFALRRLDGRASVADHATTRQR